MPAGRCDAETVGLAGVGSDGFGIAGERVGGSGAGEAEGAGARRDREMLGEIFEGEGVLGRGGGGEDDGESREREMSFSIVDLLGPREDGGMSGGQQRSAAADEEEEWGFTHGGNLSGKCEEEPGSAGWTVRVLRWPILARVGCV